MELDGRIAYLESIILPISRLLNLQDSGLRPPNAYGDWLDSKAKEHSYYQNWTQLDQRGIDFLYARLESVHLLMKAQWVMSRTFDYQSDDYDLRKLDSIHWYNYRKQMKNLKRWEMMLIKDIKQRLEKGEKPIHFASYEPQELKEFQFKDSGGLDVDMTSKEDFKEHTSSTKQSHETVNYQDYAQQF